MLEEDDLGWLILRRQILLDRRVDFLFDGLFLHVSLRAFPLNDGQAEDMAFSLVLDREAIGFVDIEEGEGDVLDVGGANRLPVDLDDPPEALPEG